ncbi:hypothetical protein [Xanthomonas phage DES1]|nr:hypothetical protein [Xanthomonas phage DES1]
MATTTGTGSTASQWIGLGLSALGGYADSKVAGAQVNASIAQNRKEQALEAEVNRKLAVDEAATNYYYNRLGRERKRNGLSAFRQFRSAYAQDSV